MSNGALRVLTYTDVRQLNLETIIVCWQQKKKKHPSMFLALSFCSEQNACVSFVLSSMAFFFSFFFHPFSSLHIDDDDDDNDRFLQQLFIFILRL